MKQKNNNNIRNVGMAHQKVCKQGKNYTKVKVNIQSPIPASFSHQSTCKCKKMQGQGFAYQPSLLYNPYLVCILVGMPSLHLFTFLMFLFVSILLTRSVSYQRCVNKLTVLSTSICKQLVSQVSTIASLLLYRNADSLIPRLPSLGARLVIAVYAFAPLL